jgi:hypothetical protein
MGFAHVQCASNGLTLAEPGFAEQAVAAGLQLVYLQFDGVDDLPFRKLRGAPLLATKRAAVEACRRAGIRICLVPTIVKGVNDDQVGLIFASRSNARRQRHRLPVCLVSGRSLPRARGEAPIAMTSPQRRRRDRGLCPRGLLPGQPGDAARASCRSSTAKIGRVATRTAASRPFFCPRGRGYPDPRVFDLLRLFGSLNDLAAEIEAAARCAADRWDLARAVALRAQLPLA